MSIKKLVAICLLMVSCLNLSAQNLIDEEITYLINSGDYLNLSLRYEEEKNNIQNPITKMLAEAYIHTAFNKPAEANKILLELITKHQQGLGISGITACMALLAENLKYEGKYATAVDLVKSYIGQTDTFDGLPANTREFFTSLYPLQSLGDLMKPEISRPVRNCVVPIVDCSLSEYGFYLAVNTIINDKENVFILDTGCDGHSTNLVTEKFAKENGIRILNDSILIQGVHSGYVKLGTADKMQIGEITYRNVAFTIAPGDNILSSDTYKLDAVLGSVFLKAMGECQILPNEKKIIFPLYPTPIPATGQNMMFKGNQPYIEAFTGEERLLFHLDTGGGDISLTSKFYQEHEDEVKAEGTLVKGGGIGGFGGVKYIDKYMIKDFPLTIGESNKKIPEIAVYASEDETSEFHDGNLGADFLKQYNKVIINFNRMFVIAE